MVTLISEKAKKVLREAGLTEYETRAYLSLLGQGVSTASEVSENGNIPYSKVYETLNSLVKKDWIETDEERPRRYFPKSPFEALEGTKLKIEDMISRWKQVISGELQPFYERREIREKPDIWILRGEYSVLAKVREMVNSAKKELMVAAPFFTKDFIESALPLLSRLRDDSVNVRLMITKEWSVKRITSFDWIRIRKSMFGGGVISDGKEALLLLGEDKPTLVIWSNHRGLVRFARDYFQYLWESAKIVKRL